MNIYALERILQNGANLNLRNLLALSIDMENDHIVTTWLRFGADPTNLRARTHLKETVDMAIRKSHLSIVEGLLPQHLFRSPTSSCVLQHISSGKESMRTDIFTHDMTMGLSSRVDGQKQGGHRELRFFLLRGSFS